MAIYEFEGKRPQIHVTTYVHPEATIIGDVIIGDNCYIGPGARIRGDWGAIEIGGGSNIQENCVIHAGVDEKAILGRNCHVGHGAVLHGTTLEEHVTVGMNAVVLDNSIVGVDSCVGAGAVVTANTVIPPKSMVLGVPGKVVSEISPAVAERLKRGTEVYHALPKQCYNSMKEIPDTAKE